MFRTISFNWLINSLVLIALSLLNSPTEASNRLVSESAANRIVNGSFQAMASTNCGVVWEETGRQFILSNIAYGNGHYVALGANGSIGISTDGLTWTRHTYDFRKSPNKLIWGNGLFIAVGNAGVILTSPDGITWTSRASALLTTFWMLPGKQPVCRY